MPDIKGYRELSAGDIDYMNMVKEVEVEVGVLWRQVADRDGVDLRWANIAKTHFQEGFTALVRSIAKPEDVF